MKADFIIVGVMKSGTTTLAHHFSRHPEIAIPEKEVHYFDYDENYNRGEGWYEKELIQNAKTGTKIMGEKTPYSFYTYTAERIYKYKLKMSILKAQRI